MRPPRPIVWLALLIALAGAAGSAAAEEPRSWTQVKCDRYRLIWTEALARFGERGIGEAFRARHAAFLESGCTARADVCPRSPEELALANALTVAAMNFGTASTFLPFACRD